MPEISLLEPQVLQGVVSKMPVKDDLVFLKSAPRESTPFPFFQWEVQRGSRRISVPNVANAEAHLVGRLGTGQQSASLIYLRDKKTFNPTTLHWLKAVGHAAENRANAEAAVMRELEDLVTRQDVFWELAFWKAFQNDLSFDGTGGVKADVDYHFPSAHENATANWGSTVTTQTIVENIKAWRKLIRVNGQVEARTLYGSSTTLEKLMQRFTTSTNVGMLSDRMKDEWFSTGQLSGFLGLDWRTMDAEYTDASGNIVKFLPDDKLLLGNWTDGRPYTFVTGPSADFAAPGGYTGRFVKTWEDPDPSGKQLLVESHGLPVIKRPENFLVSSISWS